MMNYKKIRYQTIVQDVNRKNLDKGEQSPQFSEYKIGSDAEGTRCSVSAVDEIQRKPTPVIKQSEST
jgi:hypothetical protein